MKQGLLEHYALALFELSKEENKVEEYYQDVLLFTKTLVEDKEVFTCLSSYALSTEKRNNLLTAIFEGHIQPESLYFLHILCRKHLIKDIEGIQKAYTHLYNEEKNIAEGLLYSAFPLEEETIKKIEETFSKKIGKTVHLKMMEDPKLLAGMKIFIQDTMYDYSLDSKIEAVKEKLLYKKS